MISEDLQHRAEKQMRWLEQEFDSDKQQWNQWVFQGKVPREVADRCIENSSYLETLRVIEELIDYAEQPSSS